jgi:hypothetical protein
MFNDNTTSAFSMFIVNGSHLFDLLVQLAMFYFTDIC